MGRQRQRRVLHEPTALKEVKWQALLHQKESGHFKFLVGGNFAECLHCGWICHLLMGVPFGTVKIGARR